MTTSFTERQQEIINVSISLIAEKGIQQLTIKNIARSLGISEPAIYRHFEHKLDILMAILSFFKTEVKISAEKISSNENSVLKQLETAFTMHFKRFVENPALAAVIFSEEIFQNDQKLSNEVADIMKINQRFMSDLIKKGQSNNELRTDISYDQLALIIMGALRLIVTKWRLANLSFDLESEGSKLWISIRQLLLK